MEQLGRSERDSSIMQRSRKRMDEETTFIVTYEQVLALDNNPQNR